MKAKRKPRARYKPKAGAKQADRHLAGYRHGISGPSRTMNLSRRGLFGGMGAALLLSTAPAALFATEAAAAPVRFTALDIDRIAAIISARIDANPPEPWGVDEIEAHKRLGGWPEYGTAGARMQGPALTRSQLLSEII